MTAQESLRFDPPFDISLLQDYQERFKQDHWAPLGKLNKDFIQTQDALEREKNSGKLSESQYISQNTTAFKKYKDAFNAELELQKNSQAYQSLLKGMNDTAYGAVLLTLHNLTNIYELGTEFFDHLPTVVALDGITYLDAQQRLTSDSDFCFSGCPTTFFSKKHIYELNHPQGKPAISVLMENVDLASVIEETLHFLQYLHEEALPDQDDDEFIKGIGFIIPGELKKGIIPVTLNPEHPHSEYETKSYHFMNREDFFSEHVLHECTAYFTRKLFDVAENDILEILGQRLGENAPESVQPDTYTNSLSLLCEQGLGPCYDYLKKQHHAESITQLVPNVFGRGTALANDLVHLLGYGLGNQLDSVLESEEQLQELSSIFFRPERNPNKKIDELVTFYHQNKSV